MWSYITLQLSHGQWGWADQRDGGSGHWQAMLSAAIGAVACLPHQPNAINVQATNLAWIFAVPQM